MPNLAVMDDAWTYEIGFGHQFTEKLAANLTYIYEHEEGSNLILPLAPTKGFQSVALGGRYQSTDAISLSGSFQYSWMGNASSITSPPNVVRAKFNKNEVIGFGFKVGLSF